MTRRKFIRLWMTAAVPLPVAQPTVDVVLSFMEVFMTEIANWHITGDWFDNCSCAVACPCTFAQAPDNGFCESVLFWHIRQGLARVAVLSNPLNPNTAPIVEQTKAAAQSLGVEIHVAEVQAPDKFGSAFVAITSAHAGARIAAAADRDRRCAQGDQPLDI